MKRPNDMPREISRILRSLRNRFRSHDGSVVALRNHGELEKALGYKFNDKKLLLEALVHRSLLPEASNHDGDIRANERLEFLGDSVLSLVVNNFLFREYPDKTEGELTKMKSIIVSKQILSHYAKKCNLGKYILMSESAQKAGVDEADSVLADSFEAVLGAVFLDGGFSSAQGCIEDLLLSNLKEIIYNEDNVNFKSLLQEYIQALHKTFPHYKVLSTSGPDHDKLFNVEVSVRGRVLATGTGRTKKHAEQEAARTAYKRLSNVENPENGANNRI